MISPEAFRKMMDALKKMGHLLNDEELAVIAETITEACDRLQEVCSNVH